MSEDSDRRTYDDAGYNGFLRRTIASNPQETKLSDVGQHRSHQPNNLALDSAQVSGSIGDVFMVGDSVEISGPKQRITIKDGEKNDLVRLGNQED